MLWKKIIFFALASELHGVGHLFYHKTLCDMMSKCLFMYQLAKFLFSIWQLLLDIVVGIITFLTLLHITHYDFFRSPVSHSHSHLLNRNSFEFNARANVCSACFMWLHVRLHCTHISFLVERKGAQTYT